MNRPRVWQLLFSRPVTFRAHAVLIASVAAAIAANIAAEKIYRNSELYRELAWKVASGSLDPAIVYGGGHRFTISVAFFVVCMLTLQCLLGKMVLRDSDLNTRFYDNPWIHRIERFWKLQLGPARTLIAAAFGIAAAAVFDWLVASNMLGNFIGQLARVLADGFVLVYGASVAAMVMKRPEEEVPSTAC